MSDTKKIQIRSNGKISTITATVTEWTNGPATAEDSNGNRYVVVDRDSDGAIFEKE